MKVTLKLLLLVSIVFILIFTPIFTWERSNSENSTNQGFVTGPTSIQPIKYSIENHGSYVNLIISRIVDNQYFDILYYNQTPSIGNLVQEFTIYPYNEFNISGGILDFNFFFFNSYLLTSISYISNNVYYMKFALLLNNKVLTTYTLQGASKYTISYVTTFSNSSDVYFSFYNDQSFGIVKFYFSTLKYFNFYSTNVTQMGGEKIADVNVFKLDNKLFCSILSKVTSSNDVFNSTVIILNQQGVLFNRLFRDFEITTFTSYSTGLLFYSMMKNSFYNYDYQTNSINSLALSDKNFYNLSTFKPFDNNTFLVLGPNTISLYSITNSSGSLIVQSEKNYVITDSNNPTDHAVAEPFILQSQKWYIYKGISNTKEYTISMLSVLKPPSDFTPLSTDSNLFSTTDSVITPNIDLNFPILFLLLLIISVICSVYIISSKQKKNDLNKNVIYDTNKLKVYTSSQKNYGTIGQKNEKTNYNSFCTYCGEKFQQNDVFCMNCGKELK